MTQQSQGRDEIKGQIAFQLKEHHLPYSIHVPGSDTGNLEHCVDKIETLITDSRNRLLDELMEKIGKNEPTMGAQDEAGHISIEDCEAEARNCLRIEWRSLITGMRKKP